MRDFQTRGKFSRLLTSKPVLVVLLAVALFSAWSVISFWQKMNETGKKRATLENKVIELKDSKSHLGQELEKLQSDRGIEEILREDFGLSRAGEGVIVIIEDRNAEPAEKEERGFWAFWRGLFK